MSFVNTDHLTTTEPDETAGRPPLRAKLARWGKGAAGVLARGPVRLLPRRAAAEQGAGVSSQRCDDRPPRACAEPVASAIACERSDEGLEIAAIIAAYRRGLLPEHDQGRVTWLSPASREAIAPQELRIGAPLRRLLRERIFRVSLDDDFAAILAACGEASAAEPGHSGDLACAFMALHEEGYAHSVEIRSEDGTLAGGLYGIAIGEVFFAEARFERRKKASAVALAVLHHHLCHWGFALRSARWASPGASNLHMMDCGAFQVLLDAHAHGQGRMGRWAIDPSLDTHAWSHRPRCLSRRSRSGPLPPLAMQDMRTKNPPAAQILAHRPPDGGTLVERA